MIRGRTIAPVCALALLGVGWAALGVRAAPAVLSREGKALMSIRVAPDASEEVRRSAADLARKVRRVRRRGLGGPVGASPSGCVALGLAKAQASLRSP